MKMTTQSSTLVPRNPRKGFSIRRVLLTLVFLFLQTAAKTTSGRVLLNSKPRCWVLKDARVYFAKEGSDPLMKDLDNCPQCAGKGKMYRRDLDIGNMKCGTCDGTGNVQKCESFPLPGQMELDRIEGAVYCVGIRFGTGTIQIEDDEKCRILTFKKPAGAGGFGFHDMLREYYGEKLPYLKTDLIVAEPMLCTNLHSGSRFPGGVQGWESNRLKGGFIKGEGSGVHYERNAVKPEPVLLKTQPDLPSGWLAIDFSGQTHYYNSKTKEVTWKKPEIHDRRRLNGSRAACSCPHYRTCVACHP